MCPSHLIPPLLWAKPGLTGDRSPRLNGSILSRTTFYLEVLWNSRTLPCYLPSGQLLPSYPIPTGPPSLYTLVHPREQLFLSMGGAQAVAWEA